MKASSFYLPRRRLAHLAPKSGLGRFTLYLLLLDLFIYGLRRVLSGGRTGGTLDVWVVLLTTTLVVLGFIFGLRWFRRQFMWRLRNRLIVTYIFIGVIPVVLLLAMGTIAGLLFAGQFATFVASADIEGELRALEAANSALANAFAGRLQQGAPISSLQGTLPGGARFPQRQVVVWFRRKGSAIENAAREQPSAPPASLVEKSAAFSSLVEDSGQLYMRAVRAVPLGGDQLLVLSSMPFDQELLQRLVSDLGEVTLSRRFALRTRKQRQSVTVKAQPGKDEALVFGSARDVVPASSDAGLTVRAGKLPSPSNRLDVDISFIAPITLVDWNTGEQFRGALLVTTRPSLLYRRLSASFGENANSILMALVAIAIVFALIELAALLTGIRLTRTMTRSVAELYEGTQHINRGDLKHRIQVTAHDQLAALESSFNSMSESLEKLIAEQKEKQRLENELAIAQEVQAQLFPQSVSDLESLEVHGVCRPARTVSGDYYDFLPLGPDRLGIAVGDVSGKGISAALLMATIHSAVRAYEFGRMPVPAAHLVAAGAGDAVPHHVFEVRSTNHGDFSPAQILGLLNRQLYRSTPAEKYATLFLGVYDGGARTFTYSNAGHLPPIILGHDGSLRRLDTPGLVTGLFDDQSYEERTIDLRPGDIFLAFSDGVTEPENEFGEFGEHRLIEIVREHRHLPLARISEMITSAVSDWIGANEQPDDITIVLARAR